MVTKEERKEEINNLGDGINRYILLFIKQINNKDLLYSTENYIQYLIITYNEKNLKKNRYTYTHIYTHT